MTKRKTNPRKINICVDKVASSVDRKCTNVCSNINPQVEHTEWLKCQTSAECHWPKRDSERPWPQGYKIRGQLWHNRAAAWQYCDYPLSNSVWAMQVHYWGFRNCQWCIKISHRSNTCLVGTSRFYFSICLHCSNYNYDCTRHISSNTLQWSLFAVQLSTTIFDFLTGQFLQRYSRSVQVPNIWTTP